MSFQITYGRIAQQDFCSSHLSIDSLMKSDGEDVLFHDRTSLYQVDMALVYTRKPTPDRGAIIF